MDKTNTDLEFDFTPDGGDESSFSPENNESLLIEGDEPKQVENSNDVFNEPEPVAETSEPVAEPEPAVTEVEPIVEQQVVEEIKIEEPTVPEPKEIEEVKQEEPAVVAEPIVAKPTKNKSTKKEKKTEKKSSKGWLLLLLLLLLGGGAWYYYKYVYTKPVPAPVAEEPKVVEEPVPVVEIPAEPMVIDTVPPAPPVPPEPRIATELKVPTRGWLIAYRALPNEVEAIKLVAELSYVDEFPCGYYWIPDARSGQNLFKIYIGPYMTKADAEMILPRVQAKRADAYIYTEDPKLQEQE